MEKKERIGNINKGRGRRGQKEWVRKIKKWEGFKKGEEDIF